jgi:hypothetical protein
MLKLALSLVFIVGLAMSSVVEEFNWENIPESENSSQCVYRSDERSLDCRAFGVLMECPAALELNSSLKFEVFGIGRNASIKSLVTPIESRVFELYPRKLNNQTYHKVFVDDKPAELFLYFGKKSSSLGIRVTDRKCFIQLIHVVFGLCKSHDVANFVEGNKTEKVDFIGEVLIAEKKVDKRSNGFKFLLNF